MTPKPALQVSDAEWEIIAGILQRHVPDHEIWAFGSRARGTARPFSDLDLAILSDEPLSLPVSAALAEAFAESDLPWKVDLVDWARAGAVFRDLIAQDRVILQVAAPSPNDPRTTDAA